TLRALASSTTKSGSRSSRASSAFALSPCAFISAPTALPSRSSSHRGSTSPRTPTPCRSSSSPTMLNSSAGVGSFKRGPRQLAQRGGVENGLDRQQREGRRRLAHHPDHERAEARSYSA